MGNKGSKGITKDGEITKLDPGKFKLSNVLDHIATKYILTQNFKDLTNLEKEEYCNKLIIMTSDIIKKYFNEKEIKYLEQRYKNGIPVEKITEDAVIFLGKEDLPRLEVMSKLRKKRMCLGIAKFYIKIAHLFAAIVKTINPEYKFRTAEGVTEIVGLLQKDKIPQNAKVSFVKSGLCARRIKALQPVQDTENGYIIKGRNCDMNKKTSEQSFSSSPEEPLSWSEQKIGTKRLSDEEGIPELEFLYRDIYDYYKGKYTSMSDKSKKQYMSDLKTFYTTFTGQSNMPESITKFSDIPLKDFHSQSLCQDRDSPWKKTYTGNKNTGLMKKYADHLSYMMNNAEKTEHELIGILNKIFVYWTVKDSSKKTLTIDPKLTEESLDKIISEARNIIIKLYITCEKDFQTGLGIFEAIIKKKMLDTAQQKVDNLIKKADTLLTTQPEISVVKEDVSTTLHQRPTTTTTTTTTTTSPAVSKELDYEMKNIKTKSSPAFPVREPVKNNAFLSSPTASFNSFNNYNN
jgi:hypothetical protein